MSAKNSLLKNSLVSALVRECCSLYLLVTGKTTRIEILGRNNYLDLEKQGKNFIFAVWHCRQVFPIFAAKHKNICALVSQSGDGEIIAGILRKFGFGVVRGSTSKGGPQALMGLIEKAQQGLSTVLTPDGPRGPRKNVQPGIIYLAQRTGLPIIPVSCAVSNKIVFNSWDKFQLPLPFGRAALIYGAPIFITQNDAVEVKSAELEASLNEITGRAEQIVAG